MELNNQLSTPTGATRCRQVSEMQQDSQAGLSPQGIKSALVDHKYPNRADGLTPESALTHSSRTTRPPQIMHSTALEETLAGLTEVENTQDLTTNLETLQGEPAATQAATLSSTPLLSKIPETPPSPEPELFDPAFAVLGLTPERLAAVKNGTIGNGTSSKLSNRQLHINVVRENVEKIVAWANGAIWLASATVLRWMVENGHGKTAAGRVIVGSNGVGDVLGGHGLNLPKVVIGGKPRYLITLANATQAEKDAAQAKVNELTAKQLAALPYA